MWENKAKNLAFARVGVWLVWTHSPPEPETDLQRGRVQGVMPTNILPGKSAYKQTITPAPGAAAHLWLWLSRHGSYQVIMSIFPRPAPQCPPLLSARPHVTRCQPHPGPPDTVQRDQRGMLWHWDQMSRLTPHLTRHHDLGLVIARKRLRDKHEKIKIHYDFLLLCFRLD